MKEEAHRRISAMKLERNRAGNRTMEQSPRKALEGENQERDLGIGAGTTEFDKNALTKAVERIWIRQ